MYAASCRPKQKCVKSKQTKGDFSNGFFYCSQTNADSVWYDADRHSYFPNQQDWTGHGI